MLGTMLEKNTVEMKHRKQKLLRNHSTPNAYIWNTITNFKNKITI